MESIVHTEGLSKEYKRCVPRKECRFADPRGGEVYGFLGPNGAGKSTTMKMLLGLAKPTKGTVHLLANR